MFFAVAWPCRIKGRNIKYREKKFKKHKFEEKERQSCKDMIERKKNIRKYIKITKQLNKQTNKPTTTVSLQPNHSQTK